ncbi:MAG: hypothetical protein RL256_934 [Actinomycetota bacterium]
MRSRFHSCNTSAGGEPMEIIKLARFNSFNVMVLDREMIQGEVQPFSASLPGQYLS